MIERPEDLEALRSALARSPVTVLTGPRQVGKSTLARVVADDWDGAVTRFDLEDPRHAARLAEPMLALEDFTGLVIIDEAQHSPALFPVLRVLADRAPRAATFLVLGSASPDLVGLASESLAGRVELVELGGLRVSNVGTDKIDRLWLHGGLPRSFIASATDSWIWRQNYVATFLERDLPRIGIRIPAAQLRRFWTMLAHYHGQTWNGSELARALGVSHPTVRKYLDALTDALVVRQLQPWYANVGKRVVRSPKVYVRDSGLLHTLLGLQTRDELLNHPKVGASWEGFVIEQAAILLGATPIYFWGTQGGAEIDLYFEQGGRRIGIEVKRADAPRMTPSIRNAINDLHLDRVYIVAPGPDRYPIAENVDVISPSRLAQCLAQRTP